MKRQILLTLLISISLLGLSQNKEMSIVDFLNVPGISNLQLSPNGNEVIYILSESEWKACMWRQESPMGGVSFVTGYTKLMLN